MSKHNPVSTFSNAGRLLSIGLLGSGLLGLAGCGLTGGGAEEGSNCDLSIDNLDGQTFVMLEALPDKSTRPNPLARVKFAGTGEDTTAKYTVMSLSDVYDYDCTIREKKVKGKKLAEGETPPQELYCKQPEKPKAYCLALMAGGDGICSKRKLKKVLQEEYTDEQLNKFIVEAKAEWNAKEKAGGLPWKQFKAFNNSLLNKLQGRIYVSVDEKRCRLTFGDYYFTILNGRGAEDSNPVGQNPFVKVDQEYHFQHCDDGRNFAPWKEDKLPADMSLVKPNKPYGVDTDVYFHYLGPKGAKAEKDCTYEAEIFSGLKAQPVGTVPIKTDDKGMNQWVIKHQFPQADALSYAQKKTIGLIHANRFKTCGGKREKIDMVCGLVLLGKAAPQAAPAKTGSKDAKAAPPK